MLSQDKALQLNIDENTEVILENGQTFTGNLGNHYLIVIYTNSTRSIPAQTNPVFVMILPNDEVKDIEEELVGVEEAEIKAKG